MPELIVLNGTSSAGKTSLSHALQDKMQADFLHMSWDMFLAMRPQGRSNFPRLKDAFVAAARATLDEGHNLILDVVCPGSVMELMREKLKDYQPFAVSVQASLETLRQREAGRADRDAGLAESQIELVSKGIEYDFAVDTTSATPKQAADLVAGAYAARSFKPS